MQSQCTGLTVMVVVAGPGRAILLDRITDLARPVGGAA